MTAIDIIYVGVALIAAYYLTPILLGFGFVALVFLWNLFAYIGNKIYRMFN